MTHEERSANASRMAVRLPPTWSRRLGSAFSPLMRAMTICLMASPAPWAPVCRVMTSCLTVLFLCKDRVTSSLALVKTSVRVWRRTRRRGACCCQGCSRCQRTERRGRRSRRGRCCTRGCRAGGVRGLRHKHERGILESIDTEGFALTAVSEHGGRECDVGEQTSDSKDTSHGNKLNGRGKFVG